ncbi:UvrD-helicase domain-containing protein [Ktedonobacter racemifer]|uniref:DNA 3'-5' helicase n=1 Tax=Ktedonobacter racemifer DSM 44963 TaxID=485913 RepID=D6TS02_KTERA|nr:ATP-dependent DNA helicase [Ktedonobacter racemifer]EFH86075.1 UvrD/REP helicase [Ktedonobacter racemifer DSM 44963]
MIHPQLHELYHGRMNEEQQAIISHREGPLLVIAGPGSGKTHSITLLAMNLLLSGEATPSQLILCTYTEKAALEMQDRLAGIAKAVDYRTDLSQLKIDTIHGLCNRLVEEHLHHTPLGNGYEILNQFTQPLLIFEHLTEICHGQTLPFFVDLWGNHWQVAKRLGEYFDKVTEELIFEKLKKHVTQLSRPTNERDKFLYALTYAYKNYQQLLAKTNRVDFAHLQKCAYNLLQKRPEIIQGLRYILVDEYQDTNYIQEQILLTLARATESYNLVVVGDEDQALYRFRGATVRNILEFTTRSEFASACVQHHLTTNYRSHPQIIDFYNRWMRTLDWRNGEHDRLSRTEKIIQADPQATFSDYPSVLTLQDADVEQEAEQLAELIYTLKEQGRISDYNQVAFLLYSVRSYMSETYIEAFHKQGIAVHCPRARQYFEQEEIRLIIACFAYLLDYDGMHQDTVMEYSAFPGYVRACLQQLHTHPALVQVLQLLKEEVVHIIEAREQPGKQLLDYFYLLLFHPAFSGFLANETQRTNLVAFSQHLATFHRYYRDTSPDMSALGQAHARFMHTFLCLLYENEANLPENPNLLFPSDHVQMMTIHQAKGLEFPVVIVGRLDKASSLSRDEYKNENKHLQGFYHRKPFEAEEKIATFDFRRLYYVAFSRAKHLLILTAKRQPHVEFATIWRTAPESVYARDRLRLMPCAEAEPHTALKPRYSFTGHIQLYATCPRRFQFFRQFNFVPRRAQEPITGLAVHHTLERIHRLALEQPHTKLDDSKLISIFEYTFAFLAASSPASIEASQREQALQQVLNYVHANQQALTTIADIEARFRVERDRYILTGQIDLLMQGSQGLDIMDFKTSKRPEQDTDYLAFYRQQLYLYASALQARTGQAPRRLFLYWTAEEHKKDALMEIPYTPTHIQEANDYVEEVVTHIQRQDFAIQQLPHPGVCKACDVRHLCRREGIV